MSKKLLILTALLLAFPTMSIAPENDFQEALSKVNRGEVQEAIRSFEALKQEMPNDSRLYLSLGLLYQSNGQLDEAIRELDRANSLSPSLEASFALALLYESKIISAS